jgi:beta-lactamase regulating signal transducer with metallopeptidase domain
VFLALCLLTVSSGLVIVGPRVLSRLTGSGRWPLSGILAWQVASWSVLGGVGLAAALLASPSLAAAGRLPAGLESCLASVRRIVNPADNPLLQAMALVLLAGIAVRLASCLARTGLTNHRRRARHRMLLSLVAHHHPQLDAHVIDDDTPLVYCLPGHGGRVVFTSAALERLSGAQRQAVLAHERAHLQGRHHLLIASATVLARAFPRVSLFAQSREHTVRLVEMRADDVAVRRHGRRLVAEALLVLADMARSDTVLAATGVTTAVRIERLLRTPTHVRPTVAGGLVRASGVFMVGGLFVASPLLLAIVGHAALCLI